MPVRSGRRATSWRLAVATSLLLVLVAVAGGRAASVAPKAEVYGIDGTTGTEVMGVGSVIAQGRLKDGLCVFDRPVGVEIHDGGDEGPSVTWQLDSQCRAVITAVDVP